MQQRLGSSYRVTMSFGLHFGWAIEGAVGTEFKIDASYLSPNVSIALAVEEATQVYQVSILVSETVVELCNAPIESKCRLIDKVVIKGSKVPIRIYSVDLDFRCLKQDPPMRIPWNARQRFRARQHIETQKAAKLHLDCSIERLWHESHAIVDMRERYTTAFLQWFNMGYQNYAEGEWQIAQRQLKRAEGMLGQRDGPIHALLRYMESNEQLICHICRTGFKKTESMECGRHAECEHPHNSFGQCFPDPHNYQAPQGWIGVRPLLSAQAD